MHILVTGSTGQIGRMQVETLREAGHEVREFDQKSDSAGAKGEFIEGDLRDLETVRRAVRGVDVIVHAGAIAADKPGADAEVLSCNVQGTWNILLAAVDAEVPRVVAYSSVNALGCFLGYREAVCMPIGDDYPHHPMSAYQLSKHLMEEACRSFSDRHGLVTIALRPVLVVRPDRYEKLLQAPEAERERKGRVEYFSYVDMRDVCAAGELAISAGGITHDAFLLSAADTLMDCDTESLVDRFYPGIPWTMPRREYFASNPRRSLIDTTHAAEKLGWQPRFGWRDAVNAPQPAGVR